jgi:NTP pyrophosphatase (non-canonical NTP hydrolase)
MPLKPLDVQKLAEAQRAFAKARQWDQFHTPKNLSMALVCEAAELAELFQWLTPTQARQVMKSPQTAQAIRDEIGDVLYYLVRLADKLGVDPGDCFWAKLEKSAKKYPVALARGNAIKYTELKLARRKRAARSGAR